MDFSQNEYLKIQKPKVSLLREVSKNIFSSLFEIIPLAFLPKKVHFLYGHEVYNDQFENFKKIIKKLKNDFEFVSYSEAIKLVEKRNLTERYICLSFDDGFLNNYEVAKFLYSENISAMFFVNPEVVNMSGNEAYVVEHCTNKLHCKPIQFMNWNQLKELIKWGHEIGNHGYSHRRLSGAMTDSELKQEIESSREEIKRNLQINKPHFAWCYGTLSDVSDKALELINVNHASVASAIRGNSTSLKPFLFRNQIMFHHNFKRFKFFYKKTLLPF